MIHYEENVAIVIDTLKKYRYKPRCIQHSEKCYTLLHDFWGSDCHSFIKDDALSWSRSLSADGSRDPYALAIYRLADVYEHGHVLAGHLRIHVQLEKDFQSAIDSYVESMKFCDGYKRALRASCIHFCGFLQCNDVITIDSISYQSLDSYREFIGDVDGFYKCYVKYVCHFLRYLADNGKLRPSFAMYLNSRYTPKCITIGNLSPAYRQAVDESRHKMEIVSVDDFYCSIEAFSSQLAPFGYTDNQISCTLFYLKLLYIFLDREGLGYCRAVADAWLDGMGEKVVPPNKVHTVRRALDLYDDFASTGSIYPLQRLRHLESAYSRLPLWCRENVDSFIALKRKEGCAEGSIRQLKSKASIFCEFLVSENLHSFSGLTPETVKRFGIQNKQMLPRTRNSYNAAARQFLIHMELKGLVKSSLHMALPTCYASQEKIITVLGHDDIDRILAYCRNASSPIELRDAAILLLGMRTALRACDILALKVSNIDWRERIIRVIQKKTGVAHIHSVDVETLNAIFRYVRDARSKNAVSDTIFISTVAPYASLTSSVCNDALKRAGSSVTDFHRLRRTYATDSISGGATIEEAAELLGQSDTRSLNRYVSLDIERMRLCPLSLHTTNLTMDKGWYNA